MTVGEVVWIRGVIAVMPEGSPVMLVNLPGPGGAMIPFVTPRAGGHLRAEIDEPPIAPIVTLLP